MSVLRRFVAGSAAAALVAGGLAFAPTGDGIVLEPAEPDAIAVAADKDIDVGGEIDAPDDFIDGAQLIAYAADGSEIGRQPITFGLNTPSSRAGGETHLHLDDDGTVEGRLGLSCLFGDAENPPADRVGPQESACDGQTETARDAQLVMEVQGTLFHSDLVRIDPIAPVVEGYEVINPTTIVARFSEPITHPSGTDSPSDWDLRDSSSRVVDVAVGSGDCLYGPGEDTRGGQDGCTRILTVAPALGRDATPRVDYFPSRFRGLHVDGALNTVFLRSAEGSRGEDANSLAADRVGPVPPTIEQVDGQPAEDPDSGERVVLGNQPTPTVVVGDVVDGAPVTVLVDGVEAGSAVAEGTTATVTLDTPLPDDVVYRLTATSADTALCDPEDPDSGTCANESEPSVGVDYDLDRVPPVLVGQPVTRPTTISLQFTEDLFGTDDPAHWTVSNPGGPAITITAVDDESDDGPLGGSGEPTARRTLTYEGGELTNDARLLYAPADGRYTDEHRNAVADFDVTLDKALLPVIDVQVADGAEVDRSVAAPDPVTFTVGLSEPAQETITVEYVTVAPPDGATEGEDYERASGTITFDVGDEQSEPIEVTVVGDRIDEPEEAVDLQLSNPDGARFPDATGPLTATGLIQDDDPAPSIGFTQDRYQVDEGEQQTITVELTDQLGDPITSGKEVRVAWRAVYNGDPDDTSTTRASDSDAPEQSGEVVIAPGGDGTGTFTVETFPDDLDEQDELFDLELSEPVNAAIDDATGTAEVDILDNDVLVPGVSVAAGREIFEDDPPRLDPDDLQQPVKPGAVEFEISLDQATSQSVTVPWSTTDGGTATPGEDFEETSGEVTFAPGDTTIVVEVPVIDDALNEDDETIELELGAAQGADVGTGSALAPIFNDDPLPEAQFSGTDVVVDEDAGTVTLNVELDAESGRDVTVDWATRYDDGATATDADAPDQTGSVVIDEGTTSASFEVAIRDDDEAEGDETFFVDLTAADPAELGDDVTATVTIADDEIVLPTITVDQDPAPSVTEDDLTTTCSASLRPCLTFNLRLDRAVDREVTVDFRTPSAGGTARAPADFEAASGTVTFPANSTDPQQVRVEVVDDELDEFDETVPLLLEDPVGARLPGGRSQLLASGTILDEDPPVAVALDTDERTVQEGESADFTVGLSQQSGKDVTVRWTVTGATATVGEDLPDGTGLVTIAAGETSGSFSVGTTDDTQPEDAEDFDVELEVVDDDDDGSNDPPATLGDPSVATVTIAASDQALGTGPALALSAAEVTEQTPPVGLTRSPVATTTMQFDLTLSKAPGEGEQVTVSYSTEPVTGPKAATAGQDYRAADQETVTFEAGETSKTIDIGVFPDRVDEFDEQFALVLTAPTGTVDGQEAQLPEDPSRRGVILDDDALPVIGLADDARQVEVDEGGTARLTVERDGATEREITVAWSASFDDDAEAADVSATSGEVTIGPDADTATIELPTVDDEDVEDDERLTVVLGDVTNGQLDSDRDSGVVTIIDDEFQLPDLDVDAGSVREGTIGTTGQDNGGVDVPASLQFTFRLDEAIERDVTAEFATSSSSSATPGSDFTGRSGTVTIEAGATEAVVTVDVLDDDLDEFIEEVPLVVSDVTNAELASGLDAETFLGRITDDDPAVVAQFVDGADTTVTEGNSAQFEVVLSGPSGKPVTISYATRDAGATAGQDYQSQSGELDFAPGEQSKKFSIQTLDDFVDETDEDIAIDLAVETADSATLGDRTTATLTLSDDDLPQPDGVPVLGLNGASVREGSSAESLLLPATAATATSMTFEILISEPVGQDDQPVEVTYETVAGTASASGDATFDEGEDFVRPENGPDPDSGTATIEPGQDRTTVTVLVFPDEVDEVDETFQLRLTGVTGGDAALPDGRPVARDGRILDDDALAVLGFTDASLDVGVDEGSAARLTVELAGETEKDATVDYRVVFDGGADAGEDAQEQSGTVELPAGTSSASFDITTLQDDDDEPSEEFSVVLSRPSGAALDDDADVATITINDDDLLVPQVSVEVEDVDEGATGPLGPFQPMQIASFDPAVSTPLEQGLVYRFSLSKPAERDITVRYTTVDTGSAIASSDYRAMSGTVEIPEGERSAEITVDVLNDDLDEFAETVALRIFRPDGATLPGGGSRLDTFGTVTDDDPLVTASIGDDVEVAEGDPATFTITLSQASGKDITLRPSLGNGSATAGQDVRRPSGDVTIPAGDTSATFSLQTIDDTRSEPTEQLDVRISVVERQDDPTAELGDAVARLSITDGDVDLDGTVVSLTGAAVDEGTPGTPLPLTLSRSTLDFELGLSEPADGDVVLDVVTRAGSANPSNDFTPRDGQVTIPDGQDSVTVPVEVTPDRRDEFDEDLQLVVTRVRSGNAVLPGDELARTGRIRDDDPQALLRVSDATVLEGDTASLDVTLDTPSGKDIEVDWRLVSGSATAGEDFEPASGTLTFPAGTTSRTVEVATLGDDEFDELIEQFELVLSDPVNAGSDDPRGTVSIVDIGADGRPTQTAVFLEDITTTETDSDRTALVPVRLSSESDQDVTVTWSTQRLTAEDGEDYRAEGGQVVIPAGATSAQIPVIIIGDDEVEGNEDFLVLLTRSEGAVTTGPTGRVTIQDDDGPDDGEPGQPGGPGDGPDGAPDGGSDDPGSTSDGTPGGGAGDAGDELAATGGGAGIVVLGLGLLAARRRRRED